MICFAGSRTQSEQLKQQDKDLIIFRDPTPAAKSEAPFSEVYLAAEPTRWRN